MAITEIAIEDIWLMREGGENDPFAKTVVYVKRNGQWYEAIRELAESNFSHCISANGLITCPLASRLNEESKPQEKSWTK